MPNTSIEGSGVSISPSISTPGITSNPAEELVRNYVRSMADVMKLTITEVRTGNPARQYAASMGIDITSMEW